MIKSMIGRKVLSRDGSEVGTVKYVSARYCAVCGRASCLVVEWSDGRITKPCLHGLKEENGVLKIM